MKNYEETLEQENPTLQIGCGYCWDAIRKREKPYLFFFDAANNFRQCHYCPNCGRKYLAEED